MIDIEQEMAEAERRATRRTGFDKMKERDAGWGDVRNYYEGKVSIEWNIEGGQRKREDYEAFTTIPDGMFVLHIGDKSALLDAEEFRKLFRWV